MYRTGDLARGTDRGEPLHLGRNDHQAKLRGQRVQLGEIEEALTARPAVGAACALVREDRPGDQQLTGYVTPESGDGAAPPDPEELRDALARTLPKHMVPNSVRVLHACPLSSNGKLDRKHLPAPACTSGPGRAPGTDREETLTRLFAEGRGLPRVGVDDAFFDQRRTSLLAASLPARLRDTLGARMAIGAVFQDRTPAALDARLDGDETGGDAPDVRRPLRRTGDRVPMFVLQPASGKRWC
ncbi:AMP-binding enzyme [Streptomyces rimosus]|uniref:AMP-binding enzyme n=1 Tax=Streptomyces rimosus TaxID=1927 RepID=UPI00311E1AD0